MTRFVSVVAVFSLLAFAGCSKQEEAPAPKPTPKVDPPKQPEKKMPTAEDHAKRFQECWGFWNAGDLDKLGGCYTEDATSNMIDSGMPEFKGRAAIAGLQKMYKTAFPDHKGTLQLVLMNGNNFAAVVHVTGTNSGPMTGPDGKEMPATNKKIGMLITHGGTFAADGSGVTKEWFVQDMGTMMGQLGLNPGPHRGLIEKPPADAPTVVIATDSQAERDLVANYTKMLEPWNKHDFAAFSASLADDVVLSDSSLPADINGKKGVEAFLSAYWKAFSDAKIETTAWAAGDYVVANGKFTGTNDGAMPPMLKKGTGKAVAVQYVEIIKTEGGKDKQSWLFFNSMALAAQLGLLPPAGK